jgi:acetylornithine deacetylase/succinyl-diaminopimelate desuccinylase-like protein
LAIVCDEEAGGHDGARYLVENHAAQFEGIRYAIGEAGAFGMHIGGKCLYPIMVSEKQACPMRVTMRGQGGHGSMPVRGGAMAKLAHLVRQLDRHRLPVHVTPAARLMFTATADALGGVSGALMRQFTRPPLVDGVLNLMGERGRIFDALLHNTVSATVVQASDKINVIPARVTVELDGRLLPGFGPEDMLAELRHLVGADVEIEVLSFDPYPPEPDMGLYGLLADAMRTADPAGIPVPFMASGVTDGRHFARLGIQTYGFLPTPLPPGCNLAELIHAANERIPVESVSFGADVIYDVLQRPKG